MQVLKNRQSKTKTQIDTMFKQSDCKQIKGNKNPTLTIKNS